MTDNELIMYLWELLENDLVDGDVPTDEDFTKIKVELKKRGLLEPDDELFSY